MLAICKRSYDPCYGLKVVVANDIIEYELVNGSYVIKNKYGFYLSTMGPTEFSIYFESLNNVILLKPKVG